jgi:hypothetical protein
MLVFGATIHFVRHSKTFGGLDLSIKLSDMNKRAHMEIAEGLQQGNRDAWLSLYELYAEKLWCNLIYCKKKHRKWVGILEKGCCSNKS